MRTNSTGLGIIGYGMASNLHKRLPPTTTLYIYDINPKVINHLITNYSNHGRIEAASSAKDLASKTGTMLSSLPTGLHVRKIYLDLENRVTAATKNPGRLLIECSTMEIESTQEVGKIIRDAGLGTFVNATVSGGMWGANAGTLLFMVGHADPTTNPEDMVGKCIFNTLSLVGVPSTIAFCGGLGMGQVAKIAHNYITLANNLVATEGMAIRLKYGINKKALFKCITEGTANSWVMGLEQPIPRLVSEAPSSNNYKQAFVPALSVKDLTIGIEAVRRVGIKPSAGEVALRAFQEVDDDPCTHVSLVWFWFCLLVMWLT